MKNGAKKRIEKRKGKMVKAFKIKKINEIILQMGYSAWAKFQLDEAFIGV